MKTLSDGARCTCAVAFGLMTAPRASAVQVITTDGVEAEIRAGVRHVVVRLRNPASEDQLLDVAVESAQRFLDFQSVFYSDALQIEAALQKHILWLCSDGISTIRKYSTCDISIGVSTELRDRDSLESAAPCKAPSVPWSPALRYFRLSMLSSDVFEAYRNAYLALESLLSVITPKTKSEGEEVWLRRALSISATKASLGRFAVGVSAPVDSIVAAHYKAIRVRIFHAKSSVSMLPHAPGDYRTVAAAYIEIIAIWEEIAGAWLPLTKVSSAVTYGGFRFLIGPAFQNAKTVLTDDAAPASRSDESVSPNGRPVIAFAETEYRGEARPGVLAVLARTNVKSMPDGQVVGRIAVLSEDDVLMVVDSIEGGLTLRDADRFETVQSIRLVNTGQPREF